MNYSMTVKYICNKCDDNQKRTYMTLYNVNDKDLPAIGPSMIKKHIKCAHCNKRLIISSMTLEEQGDIFEWECRTCGQVFITACMNGDDFEAIINEVICPNKSCISAYGEVNYRKTLTPMEAEGEVES